MAEVKPLKTKEEKPAAIINQLHVALDNYIDIFSDFDPSDYDRRIFSDDFLKEIQKRYVENKKGEIELTFSVPKAIRSAKVELLVKKRLKEFFRTEVREVDREINKKRTTGGVFFAFGFIVLILLFYAESLLF
ncbi:hypothetical protein KJ780_01230, partial [Candidatus Micrarchaeota archaeon]|nr:hypothetical protein [Candidatus Micrarchaeota archaeon]